jgi:hypothetical protein
MDIRKEGAMPEDTKPKRVRPRTGYVMVELSPEERKKAERIRDRRAKETGERISLAGTFRHLLREAK